ncbi:serine hydrolase [Methanospirillum hungatei]|uniref:serine hydrolase domain-containing protein n=1 Tax=Methanospirillum hungatei TaxID=2203 RepID=UPI0026F0377E|nr:serine hydrolase [Methanospirillum hungatei]MCA1916426.1 serine hydrolase [Methanospirillum hungatei]
MMTDPEKHTFISVTMICILLLIIPGDALPSPEAWRESARDHFTGMTRDEVDQYIDPLITYNVTNGLVVVLVDPHGYTIYPYGSLKTRAGNTPGNETLFDIGSVSKVMTGLLMAVGEREGVYTISAPTRTWFGDTCPIPDYEGKEITGLDLATHRSGLPSTPDAFSEYDPDTSYADQIEQSMNHYLTLSFNDTCEWLETTKLLAPPGYQYLYSNLGAAIAGASIAQAYGETYPDLLEKMILKPLGMTHSGASWTMEDLKRRANGYRGYEYPTDEAILIRFNDFWTATGGVHSNADDMAVFLAAELGLIDTPLSDAIAMTQKPYALITEGPPLMKQGLFWDILYNRDGTTILNKSGETNAHQAAIALNPDLQTGVIILADTATITGNHVINNAIALLERMQVKHKTSGLSNESDNI